MILRFRQGSLELKLQLLDIRDFSLVFHPRRLSRSLKQGSILPLSTIYSKKREEE